MAGSVLVIGYTNVHPILSSGEAMGRGGELCRMSEVREQASRATGGEGEGNFCHHLASSREEGVSLPPHSREAVPGSHPRCSRHLAAVESAARDLHGGVVSFVLRNRDVPMEALLAHREIEAARNPRARGGRDRLPVLHMLAERHLSAGEEPHATWAGHPSGGVPGHQLLHRATVLSPSQARSQGSSRAGGGLDGAGSIL
mmetsp:Transcript_23083/g.75133  ORF Transcript_23083/g.75133 Transcript_23083/m.75133 type:complete len:200 (-) Transcript_23083:626-1225(-)